MTGNQINYWNMLRQETADREIARHNKEQEAIQKLQIKVQTLYNEGLLAVERAKNYETARHNREYEAITRAHNVAQERLASATLLLNHSLETRRVEETSRHNKAVETENYRSNLAKETETRRSNQMNEFIKQEQNMISQKKLAIDAADVLVSGITGSLRAASRLIKVTEY